MDKKTRDVDPLIAPESISALLNEILVFCIDPGKNPSARGGDTPIVKTVNRKLEALSSGAKIELVISRFNVVQTMFKKLKDAPIASPNWNPLCDELDEQLKSWEIRP